MSTNSLLECFHSASLIFRVASGPQFGGNVFLYLSLIHGWCFLSSRRLCSVLMEPWAEVDGHLQRLHSTVRCSEEIKTIILSV